MVVKRSIFYIKIGEKFIKNLFYEIVEPSYLIHIFDFSLLIFLSVLTIISSLTVAGIPSGGLVTIVQILNGLNIDQNQVALIFTVDWFM